MVVTFVLDTTNEKSGTGRLFVSLARELEKKGHTVIFATEHESKITFEQVQLPMSGGGLKKVINLCRVVWIIRTLAKKSDVIVGVDVRPFGILTYFATWGVKTRFILHAVGTYSLFTKKFLRDFFIHRTFVSAQIVFVLNEFTKKSISLSHARGAYELPKTYQIGPVGVDIDLFSPQIEVSSLVETPYILSVGPLKQRKGYHLSIPAFAEVAKTYTNLKYYIVTSSKSDDDYTRLIDTLIAESGVSERIIFIRGVSDDELQKLYSHALFHILTSITTPEAIEAFGMVYAEAALCGVTSIGCKGTGAEIAIHDGETGLLAEQNIPDVLRVMHVLLGSRELRARLASHAMSLAKSLTWRAAAEPYISYLASK